MAAARAVSYTHLDVYKRQVVLLHSTSSTNAQILDELLTKWEEMGYTFKSLDQLPATQPETA